MHQVVIVEKLASFSICASGVFFWDTALVDDRFNLYSVWMLQWRWHGLCGGVANCCTVIFCHFCASLQTSFEDIAARYLALLGKTAIAAYCTGQVQCKLVLVDAQYTQRT